MTEKSLESRMSWFKADDAEMARWLRHYSKRHAWIEDLAMQREATSSLVADTSFAQNFIDNWISKSSINSEDKYNINLLRSAWRSYSNHQKTSTFTLSKNAIKSLEYLSKRLKVSKTYIVNETLIAAVKIIKNNKNKKLEAMLLLPKLERDESNFDLLFENSLSIDEIREEIKELKSEYERLQELLKNLENQHESQQEKKLNI